MLTWNVRKRISVINVVKKKKTRYFLEHQKTSKIERQVLDELPNIDILTVNTRFSFYFKRCRIIWAVCFLYFFLFFFFHSQNLDAMTDL